MVPYGKTLFEHEQAISHKYRYKAHVLMPCAIYYIARHSISVFMHTYMYLRLRGIIFWRAALQLN